MPRAAFTVDLPERVWVAAISREHPETTFRVLSAFPMEDGGYALVEVRDGDVAAAVSAMATADAVRSLDRVRRTDDATLVQFETTQLPLLVAVQRSRVPLEFPVEIRDGRVTVELTAPRERLSAFRDRLRALGLPHTLDRIHALSDPDDLLTDTQREVLVAALEAGYYDTPRETTLTDLADRLDRAPSTVSETLHRAEEAVMKRVAVEALDLDVDVDD